VLVIGFKHQVSNFQQYHGLNKLLFDERMIMSVLYLTKILNWIFKMQTHFRLNCLNDLREEDFHIYFRQNYILLSKHMFH